MNNSENTTPNQDSTASTRPTDMKTRIRRIAWDIGTVLLLPLLLLFLTTVVGFGIGRVDGISMEPSYSRHDIIITFEVRDCSSLQRGDVITFRSNQPGFDHCIKRVVALPGETIEARDDTLYVDGQEAGPSGGMWTWGSYTVPEDSVFVIGDNREDSYDSRAYGAIQFSQIESKVIWPNTQLS